MKMSRFLRPPTSLAAPRLPSAWQPTILSVFFLLLLLPASAAVGGEQETACIDLLIGKCRECHYMTRLCQSLDKKGKWAWKRSIRTMVKRGAEVSREEEKQILDCLVSKAPDVVAFCDNPPPLESMPPLKYPDGVKKQP